MVNYRTRNYSKIAASRPTPAWVTAHKSEETWSTSSRQLCRFLLLPSSWSHLNLSFSPVRVILVAELRFLWEGLSASTVLLWQGGTQ